MPPQRNPRLQTHTQPHSQPHPALPLGALLTGAAQHNGACLVERAAAEVDHAVLPHHHLLNQRAPPQLDARGVVKRAGNLAACRGAGKGRDRCSGTGSGRAARESKEVKG